MEGLKIYFRQHQLKDIDNANADVVVTCIGGIAAYVPGTVPKPNWEEMTGFTDGLDKLQLSWDSVNQFSSSSATNAAGSNYDKGISLELTFWGNAFNYIWDWLLSNQCQIINSIDVKIEDTLCERAFRIFEIKADNLAYREDEACQIEVRLREQDLVWHCVHKTMIWDNHQNWFNQTGTSVKEHPTFLTCIEPRPRILGSVRMALILFTQANPLVHLVNMFLNNENIKDNIRRALELENFVPAPLIRDYIDNVAAKCGLSVDTMFHRADTPEYNLCIYHPASGDMYQNDSDAEISLSTAFIFENRWSITLADLLDKLKPVFEAEWYVTPNNTIVFKPRKELIELAPIYDFTTGPLTLSDIEYSFDGKKKPAYGRYQYGPDGSDLGSQEISNLYNDLTDYDGPNFNPMLEGEKTKSFEFAPTAFVRDGRVRDYIRTLINDGETGAYILLSVIALLVAYAGVMVPVGFGIGGAALAVLIGFMVGWAANIANRSDNMRDYFTANESNYTGAVRLVSGNQTMAPRLLYWDGEQLNRAKVLKINDPEANLYYNPDSVPYDENNNISRDNGPLNIFNYQAYFDSKYKDNLFDRFHDDMDNPLKSLETNQSFSAYTDLCCDAMDLLGLWENDFVKIGYVIKIKKRDNYDVYGRIEHIEVDYSTYRIKLKGKVIKK